MVGLGSLLSEPRDRDGAVTAALPLPSPLQKMIAQCLLEKHLVSVREEPQHGFLPTTAVLAGEGIGHILANHGLLTVWLLSGV